jgi:hypothetical protein
LAPDRKTGREDTCDISNDTISDKGHHTLLHHAGAKDVPEDASICNTHGVDDGDAAFRYRFDGSAR